MKATELMIGDWVYIEDASQPDGMSKTKVVCITEDNTDWLHPIPLTEDILLANGWNTSAYSTLQLNDDKWLDYYHFEMRLRMWWQGIDEWQNHSEVKELIFQCHCTYVHELQHALRLCGLDDLADNFKIQ